MREPTVGLLSLMLLAFFGNCWSIGETCSNPIVVNIPAAIPYNSNQTTCGKQNNYFFTCLNDYDGGEDIIYQLNVTDYIPLTYSLTSSSHWMGMTLDDACPPDEYNCLATVTGENGPWTLSNLTLYPGTYYLMIDTYPPPSCIPSFNLSITTPNPLPPNETCAGAIQVNTIPYTYNGNLGYINDCPGRPYFEVFFNVTVPYSVLYNFNMCNSNGDTYMRIYTDGVCCSNNYVEGDDECGGDDPSIYLDLTAGQSVIVECGYWYFSSGFYAPFTLNITPQPPQNDICIGTINPRTFPYSYSGNLGLTDDCPEGPAFDVFFNITAPENGLFNFNMCGSYGDTYMRAYIDQGCCSYVSLEGYDECSGDDPSIDYNLTAGQIVYLECGYNSPTGGAYKPYNLNISYVPSFNYYMRNSCGEGNPILPVPSFHWEDVNTYVIQGAPSIDPQDGYLGNDDWEGPFPIGFTFNYYNEPYTQFIVCSNGYLMLGNTGSVQEITECIGNNYPPNNMLAWLLDDLDPGYNYTLVYWGNDYVDGLYAMVVTFNNIPNHYEPTETITAQVILKENGNIKYQYDTITPNFLTHQSTIGIENRTGQLGVPYLCWFDSIYCFHDSLAIEFASSGPLPVVHVTAEVQGSDIVLRWENTPLVPQYRIYRGTEPDFAPSGTPYAIVSDTTWTDPLVIDSTSSYFYIVTASDDTTMR